MRILKTYNFKKKAKDLFDIIKKPELELKEKAVFLTQLATLYQ